MRKIAVAATIFCLIALSLVPAVAQKDEPKKTNVLVVYCSAKGHTKAMAEAVAKGARSVEGAAVNIASIPDAKVADVLAADAVIVGSPVYKANVAPPVQEFIDSWPIKDPSFRDKLGAAFVSASGISAGEELVQMDILHSMLVCGMIIVGGGTSGQPFGASAVSENPAPKPDDKAAGDTVPEYFLKKGETLGARVAQLAVRMKALR